MKAPLNGGASTGKKSLKWESCFQQGMERMSSERRTIMVPMLTIAVAVAVWTPVTIAACKWIADA